MREKKKDVTAAYLHGIFGCFEQHAETNFRPTISTFYAPPVTNAHRRRREWAQEKGVGKGGEGVEGLE